jgi:hypothetical protein
MALFVTILRVNASSAAQNQRENRVLSENCRDIERKNRGKLFLKYVYVLVVNGIILN